MTARAPRKLELVLERATIEDGRTFSAAAVDHAAHVIALWIAEETSRQWDATNVPPTRAVLSIELQ